MTLCGTSPCCTLTQLLAVKWRGQRSYISTGMRHAETSRVPAVALVH